MRHSSEAGFCVVCDTVWKYRMEVLLPGGAAEVEEGAEGAAHGGAGDDGVDLAALHEELGPLESGGEFLLEGGCDHARAGEAD